MLSEGETATMVLLVSSLSAVWSYFDYQLQKYFGREDSENALSMFHALVTLQWARWNLEQLSASTHNPANKTELSKELNLIFSCSYFLYDTFRWRYRGVASIVMLFHHFCSIWAIVNNLSGKCWGEHGVLALLLLEGSNPLLHFRRILIGEGLRHKRFIYTVGEWAFFLSFLLFRFALGLKYIGFIHSLSPPKYLMRTAYSLFTISLSFLVRILYISIGQIVRFSSGNQQLVKPPQKLKPDQQQNDATSNSKPSPPLL